jgi:hypothetical protein
MKIKLSCKSKTNQKNKFFEIEKKVKENIMIEGNIINNNGAEALFKKIIKQEKSKFIFVGELNENKMKEYNYVLNKSNNKKTLFLKIESSKRNELKNFLVNKNLSILTKNNLFFYTTYTTYPLMKKTEPDFKKMLNELPKTKKEKRIIMFFETYNLIERVEEITEIFKELNSKGYYLLLLMDSSYGNSGSYLLDDRCKSLFDHIIKITSKNNKSNINDLENHFEKKTLEFNYYNKDKEKNDKTSLLKLPSKNQCNEKEIDKRNIINVKTYEVENKLNNF